MRWVFPLLAACGLEHTPPTPPPDVRCTDTPAAATTGFRHVKSSLIAASGDPHHRGIDLIASTADTTQTLAGAISYGLLDKALEDEDVSLFGCVDDRWQALGTARTDGEGRFALDLATALPVGLRDLFVSVDGDRSGARFLAFVAEPGTPIVVSDVDGTLTDSENAYPESLVTGATVDAQPNAAAALAGHTLVYLTARGDRFTQDTRDWLAAQGFPRGPLRMPSAIVTQSGADTAAFKSAALATLGVFEIVAGIGNRDSDITAYTGAGVAAYIKLPEFLAEVAADLNAGKATGFDNYAALVIPSSPGR